MAAFPLIDSLVPAMQQAFTQGCRRVRVYFIFFPCRDDAQSGGYNYAVFPSIVSPTNKHFAYDLNIFLPVSTCLISYACEHSESARAMRSKVTNRCTYVQYAELRRGIGKGSVF